MEKSTELFRFGINGTNTHSIISESDEQSSKSSLNDSVDYSGKTYIGQQNSEVSSYTGVSGVSIRKQDSVIYL
jgi:hypothetical protein